MTRAQTKQKLLELKETLQIDTNNKPESDPAKQPSGNADVLDDDQYIKEGIPDDIICKYLAGLSKQDLNDIIDNNNNQSVPFEKQK